MDYFPLALAVDDNFCNRQAELQALIFNLKESRPTLLIATRRYGKTSLAINAINSVQFHYAHFDFLSAITETDIEKIILKGVGELITRIEKGPKKALKLAADLFAGLSIRLAFDGLGLSVEINKPSQDSSTNILQILQRVEILSKKYQQKLILFFDEFQRIYEVTENCAIESVIRQVAQASKSMSFIFSGSNRHLLQLIFSDKNRPFYKLCDRIGLERISEAHYQAYIQRAAVETWGVPLEPEVLIEIFNCTERHPYYVNLLCSRLWKLDDRTAEAVRGLWRAYAIEERSQVSGELDLLSQNQRKLLVFLARSGGTAAPRGREFQTLTQMSGATISQSLTVLEQRDYVYCNKEGSYQVLDPLFKTILSVSI